MSISTYSTNSRLCCAVATTQIVGSVEIPRIENSGCVILTMLAIL